MKLDYNLKTSEERIALVNEILSSTPTEELRPQYLNIMSDYILFVSDRGQTKQQRTKEYPITTKNREKTIEKRQTSYEGIVATLENGEDGLYALINNDKNQILDPKEPINEKDLEEIPGLQEQLQLINWLKEKFTTATGTARYNYKKQIIEAWQQLYILKAAAKENTARGRVPNQIKTMAHANLDETIMLGEDLLAHSTGLISLFNPSHISFLLCYYSQLKQESADDLEGDMHWLLLDLEEITHIALKNKPVLYDILLYKIDGMTNEEIRKQILQDYGVDHTEQYYSTLWRKRIPKLIAEAAQKQWVTCHYFNNVRSEWIKCGKCGEYKLAHPLFFSSNTNDSGYYSICKDCRNNPA